MKAISMRDVSVVAGGSKILDNLTFEIERGKIVAVVGPNGAGKTTLLDAISGTVPGIAGTVEIDGKPSQSRGGFPREGVGRVFQGSPLPDTMTVGEVISLVAGGRAQAEPVLKRFGLDIHETTFVAELSTGMRRIVDLAVATVRTPPVLLLDEPASGLAQSEIEYLAKVLRALRDQTDAGILLVEHDAWLVNAVADEIVVIDAGQIMARGAPSEVLAAEHVRSKPRVTSPRDETFTDTLELVGASAAPAPPLVRRSLSTWTILRLGLREFAAGLASVLIIGVLTRVLNVELGIGLALVTTILATYNLAAPIGLPIGHMSDTRPLLGLRRVPYIIGGALITGLAVAAAPHVAGSLQHGITVITIVLSVLLFVLMGVGMYGAGTAFFALISDLASPQERGHVAKVIYLELLAGVFFGVALTGAIIEDGPARAGGGLPEGTAALFALAGFAIVVLTGLAVWGQERKGAFVAPVHAAEPVRFRVVLREAVRMPQARLFFVFMVASTLFLFIQQAIVQSFGGRVFAMSVKQTSGLTAMVTLGTITGMIIAGRPFAAQVGHRRIAKFGLQGSVAAFIFLTLAAMTRSVPGTWLSLLAVGLALGIFNVASLSLMMSMATRARAAFFMGAWTVAHALADGMATASGGIFYTIAKAIVGSHGGAYAVVFAIEAIGLALCLPLLAKVDPDRFEQEARENLAREQAEIDIPSTAGPLLAPSHNGNGAVATIAIDPEPARAETR